MHEYYTLNISVEKYCAIISFTAIVIIFLQTCEAAKTLRLHFETLTLSDRQQNVKIGGGGAT